MFWPFSLILTWSSKGSERVGLLHASTAIKCYNEFQGHKITEFLRLERASEDCIFSFPCYSRLVWARFSQTLNISWDGVSTASMGSLYQCSLTWSSYTDGHHSLLWTFLGSWESGDLWTNLTDGSEKWQSTWAISLLPALCHQTPIPFSSREFIHLCHLDLTSFVVLNEG